jgi:hypothetical protein
MQIASLILLFAVGRLARWRGWLAPPHAGRMLQLVVNVGLPAMLVATLSRTPLSRELAALPLAALFIMLVTMAVAVAAGKAMQLPRASLGAFIICSMSINDAFLFPFVLSGWGPQAFAQLALFDVGNSILQATAVFGTAAWYGGHSASAGALLRRMLSFPPFWAVIVALAINLLHVPLPPLLLDTLGWVGRLILLLVILALGILFDVRLLRSTRVVGILLLRIAFGFALALGFVTLTGLTGLPRAVVLLAGMAPIGFSVVAMANREKLDSELAASAASLTVLMALAYVPLMLWALHLPG